MSRLAFVLLFACLVQMGAAPTAAQDREVREVDAFTEVALSVPGTLSLRQGEPRSVEVKASADVLEHIETTVEGGTLKIRDERDNDGVMGFLFGSGGDADIEEKVEVYVTAPTIEGISLAGAGTVVGETPIEASSLDLSSAGSGDVQLELRVERLEIESAGAGTFRLTGTANRVEVSSAGSGTVEALDLVTETAEIEIAGAGSIRLHVTDRLSADIIGSGDIEHRGSPTIETSVIGSGEVRSVE